MASVKQDAKTERPKPKQWPVKEIIPHAAGRITAWADKPQKKAEKPGTIPPHHIPIYDHNGHMRGRVGPKATSVTVARFLNRHGAKLGTKDGRPAWIGQEPPKPPKPIKPVAPKPTQSPAQAQNAKLEISLKTDKGSVTKTPTKPEAHARPRRG